MAESAHVSGTLYGRPASRPWLHRAWLAGVLVLDVLLTAWLGRKGLAPHHIVGTSGDPYIYLWFLHWWGWALNHHHLARVTRLVDSPYGSNVLWDTSVPLFFIPASLIHTWLGVPVDLLYNLLWVGFWAGSATVAFYTLRRLTGRTWGSFFGHLLVLFSAYENTESLAHLDLMWMGFAYLFFMVGGEWLLGRRSTANFIVWGTVLGLGQWLTNEEIFVLMWTAGALAVVLRFLFELVSPTTGRWVSGKQITGVFQLAAATALVILPLFWLQSHGSGQPLGSIQFSGKFGVDLTNLLWVPVHTIWHWGSTSHWLGNRFEDTGYLGVVFWVLAGGAWLWGRRRVGDSRLHARWIFAWWGVLVLLSLGAFFHWNGRSWSWGPAPGLFFYFLPVLRDVVMPRFMGLAVWVAGLAVALLWTETTAPRQRVAMAIGASLIALSWFPAAFPSINTHTQVRVIPQILSTLQLSGRPTVLVFPYDNSADATRLMGLQAEDSFSYRLAEGYLSPTDYLLLHFPQLVAAWDRMDAPQNNPYDHVPPFPAARWQRPALRFLSVTRPQVLIVMGHTSHEAANIRWWTAVLGAPSGHVGTSVYWRHPGGF